MASATGTPFDGSPSGATQSSAPRRRAHAHQPSVPRLAVNPSASVPALRGRLRLPRRARRRREWATSPRRYRVWVGWRRASVSDNVVDLLALIDGRRSIGELAEALGNRQGRRVHPMEVAYLIRERLAPAGLIRLRQPQWGSAPALPSPYQMAPSAAHAFAAAPAAAPAPAPLPSLAPPEAHQPAGIDVLDTIRLDPPPPASPSTPSAITTQVPADPPPVLLGDEAPRVVVSRLSVAASPVGDEVYIDEQPTMLLAPVEAPSAPAALQVGPAEPVGPIGVAEPAESGARETPPAVVHSHQTPVLANVGPSPLEPAGARATVARWEARRIGARLRDAGMGVVGVALIGLALALAIALQQAHPAVVQQAATLTTVPPTPTPLQERILPGETAYTVRQGDTLARIASAYHISQGALLLVNGDILPGPDALVPGMRLAIPAIYRPGLPASVQPRPLYYVVQSGDTLSLIGQRFGLDWHVIANYNHVPDASTLAIGQGLVIP